MKEPMATKMQSFDTGHKGMIHDTQFDYYGRHIATCSSDGCVNIFDSSDSDHPVQTATFKAHEGPVWQVMWAHPRFGNLLATCGYDHKVIIWKEVRANEWEKAKELDHHKSSVNACAWAPWEYGLILATGSSDGTVSIITYNGDGFTVIQQFNAHIEGVTSVSWGPSTYSSLLQNPNSEGPTLQPLRLATGGCDKTAKIWVRDETSKVFNAEATWAHEDWVRDVAFANNAGLPYDLVATCSEDRTVRIWRKDKDRWAETRLPKFRVPVWKVSWSLAGNLLAVAAADNMVYIYEEKEMDKWELIAEMGGSEAAKSE